MKHSALFWDLDGTLLSTNGKGWPCMILASNNLKCDMTPQDMSGLSDFQILSKLALDSDLDISQAAKDYLRCLVASLPKGSVEAKKEAVFAALKLIDHPCLESAIATGNMPEGAMHKMRCANFPEEVMKLPLFGSDVNRASRKEIVKAGLEFFGLENAIMIGDSSNDIRTAQELGFHSIGLATGYHSYSQLVDDDASIVLEKDATAKEIIDAVETLLKLSN